MDFDVEIQPVTADDDMLRSVLADADLPPLLPALAAVTGDLTMLRDDLHLDPLHMQEPQGGWTDEQVATARELAFEAIRAYRDGGSRPAPSPSGDDLGRILSWMAGTELSGTYLPMLTEELATGAADLRAPDWLKADIAPDRDVRVAVIGAGMSGILAAHRLEQAGIDHVVFEKNPAIGGTWFENTYPGCRVDVMNHVYCYSFMQKHDWPQYHSSQDVLLDYFTSCAETWHVPDRVRFDTEVTAAVYDDVTCTWTLELDTPDGDQTLEANVVISAVGQLNRPKFPDIDGRDSFEGDWFHSARWNHELDLDAKRVAVIGTGCSATQFIPHVAEQASELTVFQRTANWLVPRPEYQQELPDELLWLFDHIPGFSNWYRMRLFWRTHEGALPALVVDPDWDRPTEQSVSALNQELRDLLTLYLELEFADRPDLLAKVVPTFPPGAKRVVVDDGTWARTLKRDNVSLLTDDIDCITPTGVRTADGVDHDVDVLIYGTGFEASHFLTPMKVVGRRGIDLHAHWDGNARAYLGVTSPGFPNFFYLYGPNTNIVINGSIIYFSECEVHFVTQCIRYLLEHDRNAVEVKAEVHDAYNERIDEGNLQMAWGVSGVNSWYKSESGRVAQNWPFSLLEFWEQTREVDPDDFHVV